MQPSDRPARILVLEPEMALRQLLVRALEGERHIVVATGDVQTAAELLQTGLCVALLVTNLRLDFGGHVAFLEAVERNLPTLPILHLSGPPFQGRAATSGPGFNVERFVAAVRNSLATG